MWARFDDEDPKEEGSEGGQELSEAEEDDVSGGKGGCSTYPDTIGCTIRH